MHNRTTIKSLFLKRESSFFESARIVDALCYVKSQTALDHIAREAIELARDAWMLRERDLRNLASNVVLALDVSPKLHVVAQHYKSLKHDESNADSDSATKTLIHAADRCPAEYTARILLAAGKARHGAGDHSEALRYYAEACKSARGNDTLSQMYAVWNVAMVDYDCGLHRNGLSKFEGLLPLVRALSHRYPVLYYDYLNNLAALLIENGRTEESRRAIRVAMTSPFADRFPEWRETEREIEEAAKQEPRKCAPTGKILASARPERVAKKLPKPPRVFVVIIVGPVRISNLLSLRNSDQHVVSLLERYVKTVRIRDRP
jgi:hypothetical protein